MSLPSPSGPSSTDGLHMSGNSSSITPPHMAPDPEKGPSPPPKTASRSLRACEQCRKTKAKCCGNLPCKRCSRSRKACVYSDGKLVAQKKTVETLEQELAFTKSRNEALEELLHSVCTSPRSGLQGKMYANEATMMSGDRGLNEIIEQQNSLSLDEKIQEEPLIKRLAWPPIPVADSLINYYFDLIHPTFPLLWKPDILTTYTTWSRNPLSIATYDAADHAIINMMFAICVIHSQALQVCNQWPQIDYMSFLLRAKRLVPFADSMHPGSTLKEIQLKCLLGIYYVMHHHIDSAWAPIASGVRGSMNMGIYLNTERPSTSKAQTESQIRVWWSLISLERLLGDFTGRPSSIDPNVITCPLPSLLCESKFDDGVPSPRGSPHQQSLAQQSKSQEVPPSEPATAHSEVYAPFVHRIEMEALAHRSAYEFQKPFLMKMSEKDLRTRVSNLNTKLSNALHKLPEFLDFASDVNLALDAVSPDVHRTILAITYHHTRMIIHRPYLLKPRTREDANTSPLLSFQLSAAYYCTTSAQAIITLLPDDLELTGAPLFHVWWGYLNPICRAAAVLLMEVLFQSDGDISRCKQLLHMYQKAMKFLRSMSKKSEAALGAWETFDKTFNKTFLMVMKELDRHTSVDSGIQSSCSLDTEPVFTGFPEGNDRDSRSFSFEESCVQARQAFLPTVFEPSSTNMSDLQFLEYQYYSPQNDLWQQYLFPSMEEMNSFSFGTVNQPPVDTLP